MAGFSKYYQIDYFDNLVKKYNAKNENLQLQYETIYAGVMESLGNLLLNYCNTNEEYRTYFNNIIKMLYVVRDKFGNELDGFGCHMFLSINIRFEAFIIFNLQNISNYYNNAQLKLEDCFDYNFDRRYNTFFYCSRCQRIENNISEDKLYRPPKILVLILDRGKGKSFKGNVSFNASLDITNFVEEKDENSSFKYTLISFITHTGPSSLSGHYTAYCLTDNGKYYYFNDEYVDEINGKLYYNGEPYILFYKRNEQDNFYDSIYQIV